MTKIFYAGHLRPFRHVGHHPQFEHIQYPPPGHQFVTDAQVGARMPIRLLTSISALCRKAAANGSKLIDIAKFVRSRSIRAQRSAVLSRAIEDAHLRAKLGMQQSTMLKQSFLWNVGILGSQTRSIEHYRLAKKTFRALR